ncbi:MAG: efflux RND transporter periplasmic adaptor subunit [Bacteroidia bacterium]
MKKIISIIAALLILTACGGKKQEETEVKSNLPAVITLTDAQLKNARIQEGSASKRTISSILKLTGKIDVPPQNMVSVSMPLGGFLKSTKLLPGMRIKKGEVIATMEDQQYIQLQQDYLNAKTKLVFAETEFNRQKELNQSKAASDKFFQQTTMEYNTQKVTLNALAEKLKLININPENLNEANISRSINVYSSIDGFVSRVNVNIGKYVNPTDVLFELINPEDIHLNLKVFEKDLDKLSIGQKITAYNNNQPEKKYRCEIILISQDLSADRSAEVHCHFEEYDKSLFPGMYMNAEVEIKNEDVLTIEDEAIVSFEGKDYVFVSIEKNKFELNEVKRGNSTGGYTEITGVKGGGLEGKQIVIKGAYAILMQMKNEPEGTD